MRANLRIINIMESGHDIMKMEITILVNLLMGLKKEMEYYLIKI